MKEQTSSRKRCLKHLNLNYVINLKLLFVLKDKFNWTNYASIIFKILVFKAQVIQFSSSNVDLFILKIQLSLL